MIASTLSDFVEAAVRRRIGTWNRFVEAAVRRSIGDLESLASTPPGFVEAVVSGKEWD